MGPREKQCGGDSSDEGGEEFAAALSDLDDCATVERPLVEALRLGDHLKTDSEWAALNLSKPLLRALYEMGYEQPTVIQKEAIPVALEGHDVLGMAETGSGKTAAFLLPILERLLQSPAVHSRKFDRKTGAVTGSRLNAALKVLVLLPSRELALQCMDVCTALCKYCPITRCLLCGGISQKDQLAQLRKMPDIIIATPGRCLDFLLNQQGIYLDTLEIVVFDEADKLIDMGFKESCLALLKYCSPKRQTLLFSATLTAGLKELVQIALNNPINVPSKIKRAKIAKNVQNEFVGVADPTERLGAVLYLLIKRVPPGEQAIVFFNSRVAVRKFALTLACLQNQLSENDDDDDDDDPGAATAEQRDLKNIPSFAALHGKLDQRTRMDAVQRFRDREINVLIATDLAARGIDVEGLSLVINADAPVDSSRFVHRAGRTGRRGGQGAVITVFDAQKERQSLKTMFRQVNGSKDDKFHAKRIVAEVLQKYCEFVKSVAKNVKRQLELDLTERELRQLELTAKKEQNIATHYEEIKTRPKKLWLDSLLANPAKSESSKKRKRPERVVDGRVRKGTSNGGAGGGNKNGSANKGETRGKRPPPPPSRIHGSKKKRDF